MKIEKWDDIQWLNVGWREGKPIQFTANPPPPLKNSSRGPNGLAHLVAEGKGGRGGGGRIENVVVEVLNLPMFKQRGGGFGHRLMRRPGLSRASVDFFAGLGEGE